MDTFRPDGLHSKSNVLFRIIIITPDIPAHRDTHGNLLSKKKPVAFF